MRMPVVGFFLLLLCVLPAACDGEVYSDNDPAPLSLPTAGPPPGTYTNGGEFRVFLRTDAPGATLHWSADGGEFWFAQQTNQVAIELDGNLAVLSYVTAPGRNQSYTNAFHYQLCLPEPQIHPAGGVFTNAGPTNLRIATEASGATLFWSTNGGKSWENAVTNARDVPLGDNADVLVYAQKEGFLSSATNRQEYRFWRWRLLGAAPLSSGPVEDVRLAIHRNGPLLAYRDLGASRAVRLIMYRNGGWTNLAAPVTAEHAPGLSLSVEGTAISVAEGKPPLVHSLRGGIWAAVGEASPFTDFQEGLRVVSGGGRFWVAGIAASTNRILTRHWDGAAWVSLGEAGTIASNAGAAALSLRVAAGVPYLAWRDPRHGGRASVVRFQGGGWTNLGRPGFSDGPAADLQLAFDQGNAYLACADGGLGGRLTVHAFREGAWTNLGGTGITAGAASSVSLALEGGRLFTAARDAGHGGRFFVHRLAADGWEPLADGPVSPGGVSSATIAVSGSRVIAAYRDEERGGRLVVRRFSD